MLVGTIVTLLGQLFLYYEPTITWENYWILWAIPPLVGGAIERNYRECVKASILSSVLYLLIATYFEVGKRSLPVFDAYKIALLFGIPVLLPIVLVSMLIGAVIGRKLFGER